MIYVGIVGHEAAKFTEAGERAARKLIRELLADMDAIAVSGACHLGGVDIWTREEAGRLGRALVEFPPKVLGWEDGFKPRNLQIAQRCDIVHCVVVDALPESFTGRRFEYCYHCQTKDHVKSGGCWTVRQAKQLGKVGRIHIIRQATHIGSDQAVPMP